MITLKLLFCGYFSTVRYTAVREIVCVASTVHREKGKSERKIPSIIMYSLGAICEQGGSK